MKLAIKHLMGRAEHEEIIREQNPEMWRYYRTKSKPGSLQNKGICGITVWVSTRRDVPYTACLRDQLQGKWGFWSSPGTTALYTCCESAWRKAACPVWNLRNNASDGTDPAVRTSREKQQKEYLKRDPTNSLRVIGVLFQLVSLNEGYWHLERKENSCTALWDIQGSYVLSSCSPEFHKVDAGVGGTQAFNSHLAEKVCTLHLALPILLLIIAFRGCG